jgi:hypothetical protein
MCNQGKMGRIVSAVVLAAAISFAGPLRADVHTGPVGLWNWSWLNELWQGGLGMLPRERPASPTASHRQLKDGTCTNPLGCTTGTTTGSGGQNGQGAGSDPDGKPKP